MNATTENNKTRNESQGLLNKLESLRLALCLYYGVFYWVLNRLNVISEKLQKVEIDCGFVIELYDSLNSTYYKYSLKFWWIWKKSNWKICYKRI